jgi:hypothetical protein
MLAFGETITAFRIQIFRVYMASYLLLFITPFSVSATIAYTKMTDNKKVSSFSSISPLISPFFRVRHRMTRTSAWLFHQASTT